MEFPHLGAHCSFQSCNRLDFLPVKCDACSNVFCHDHMTYTSHNCVQGRLRDFQVPVCPLCNQPVPSKRDEAPDIAVGAHIDNDCEADKAKDRRKIFSNKCSLKGCGQKEMIRLLCSDCGQNYCIKHRHPTDHQCTKKKASHSRKETRQPSPRRAATNKVFDVQGTMSEDEALARALANSLEESEHSYIPASKNPCHIS